VLHSALQAVTQKRVLTSQAVYAILKRKEWDIDPDKDITQNTQSHNITLTKDERQGILTNNKEAKAANDHFLECWDSWAGYYNGVFEPNLTNRAKVENSGLRPEYSANDPEVNPLTQHQRSQADEFRNLIDYGRHQSCPRCPDRRGREAHHCEQESCPASEEAKEQRSSAGLRRQYDRYGAERGGRRGIEAV